MAKRMADPAGIEPIPRDDFKEAIERTAAHWQGRDDDIGLMCQLLSIGFRAAFAGAELPEDLSALGAALYAGYQAGKASAKGSKGE